MGSSFCELRMGPAVVLVLCVLNTVSGGPWPWGKNEKKSIDSRLEAMRVMKAPQIGRAEIKEEVEGAEEEAEEESSPKGAEEEEAAEETKGEEEAEGAEETETGKEAEGAEKTETDGEENEGDEEAMAESGMESDADSDIKFKVDVTSKAEAGEIVENVITHLQGLNKWLQELVQYWDKTVEEKGVGDVGAEEESDGAAEEVGAEEEEGGEEQPTEENEEETPEEQPEEEAEGENTAPEEESENEEETEDAEE